MNFVIQLFLKKIGQVYQKKSESVKSTLITFLVTPTKAVLFAKRIYKSIHYNTEKFCDFLRILYTSVFLKTESH